MKMLVSLSQAVGDFFRWWLSTLQSLVPTRLLNWFAPPVDCLILDFLDHEILISRGSKRSAVEMARLSRSSADAEAPPEVIDPIAGNCAGLSSVVRVPESNALRKHLKFPAAIEHDLRQALAFDMDRLTPFNAEQVVFDYRIVKRDHAAKQIMIELFVLPRAVLDPAITWTRKWGFRPEFADLYGDSKTGTGWRFALGEAKRKPVVSWASTAWAMAAAALILGFAIALYPLHKKHQQLDALKKQLNEAKQQAAITSALQETVEQTQQDVRFIFEKKLERPPVVRVIDELTHVMPDHTWLYRLRYQAGDLQIFGHSTAASELIASLENAPLFHSARFSAPTTQDRRTQRERFHIACTVGSEADL